MHIYEISTTDAHVNWILQHSKKLDLNTLYEEFFNLNLPVGKEEFAFAKTFVKWLKEEKQFIEPKVTFILLED